MDVRHCTIGLLATGEIPDQRQSAQDLRSDTHLLKNCGQAQREQESSGMRYLRMLRAQIPTFVGMTYEDVSWRGA